MEIYTQSPDAKSWIFRFAHTQTRASTPPPPSALSRLHLQVHESVLQQEYRKSSSKSSKALGVELVLPDLRGCKRRLEVVQVQK